MKTSGCILIDDEKLPVSKQTYTFELNSAEEYYEKVRVSMLEKLRNILPEVKEEVFGSVLV